jgi:hypothetical protein
MKLAYTLNGCRLDKAKDLAMRKVTAAPRVRVAVDAELTRARGRIHTIDAATSVLVLLVACLVFALGMISLDYWRGGLADWVRQLALGAFLVGVAAYCVWAFLLPLRTEVNPYFAARQLEKSLPGSKNAIVNYLDLKDRALPGVIRDAVNKQAAREVASADVEEAIPNRRPLRLFMLLAGLLIGMFVFSLMAPEQFGSLLARAFFPFSSSEIPSDTRFRIEAPALQDHPDPRSPARKLASVEPGQMVDFKVRVEGVSPEAVFLDIFSDASAGSPRESRKFNKPEIAEAPWRLTLEKEAIPPTGFYFRIRGGDGKSELVQLIVASQKPPRVQSIEVAYEFPAYTAREAKRQLSAPILAIEGTKVRLLVQADQPVDRGELLIRQANGQDARYPLAVLPTPEGIPADATRLILQKQDESPLVLTRPLPTRTIYSVRLVNKNGQHVSGPYEIGYDEDKEPKIELRRIGRNPDLTPDQEVVQVPANDIAPVLGRVRDDVAVDKVRLKIRMAGGDGTELRWLGPRVEQGPLQRANGYTQEPADFLLLLDLNKIADPRDGTSKPIKFHAGQTLELWVEATDTRQPKANLGKSRIIKIELTDPLTPEQQKERDNQAQQDQQRHDQNNRNQNPNENPQNNQENPAEARGEGQKGEGKPDQNARGEGKPQENKPEANPNQNARNEGKPQEGKPEANPNQNARGEGQSPEQQANNQTKPQPEQQPENQNARGQGNQRPDKPETKPDAQAREEGKPQQGQPETNAQAAARNEGKPQQGKPETKPDAQARNEGQQGPENPQPNATARDNGRPEPQQTTDKPQDKPNSNAQARNGGTQDPTEPQTKPDASARQEGTKPPTKPEEKPNAEARNEGKPDPMNQGKPEQNARGTEKPNEQNAQARNEGQKPNQTASKPPDKPQDPSQQNARGSNEGMKQEDRPNATARGQGDKPPMTPEDKPQATARNEGKPDPNRQEKPDQNARGTPQSNDQNAEARNDGQPSNQQVNKPNPDKPNANGQARGAGKPDEKKPDSKPQATARQDGDKPPTKPEEKPQATARNEGKPDPIKPEKPDAEARGQGDKPDPQPSVARNEGQNQQDKPQPQEGTKPSTAEARGSKTEQERQGNQQAEDFARGLNRNNTGFPERPDKPTEEFLKKATDLQLKTVQEQLEKGQIDKNLKELLNQLNLSPQQALDLLKQRRDRVFATALQGNMRAHGPHQAQTSGRTPQDLNSAARPNLPPELRDPFENFTRKLNP